MAFARAKGRLKGKQPKLNARQQTHVSAVPVVLGVAAGLAGCEFAAHRGLVRSGGRLMVAASLCVVTEPAADFQLVVQDAPRGAVEWLRLAGRLADRGSVGAAIVAAARAAGTGGSSDPVRSLIGAHAATLDEQERKERTWYVRERAEKLKKANADPDRIVALLTQALLDGGDPSYLLRAVAQTLDQVYSSRAALEVVRGAMALDPDRAWYEDTHALVLISLARWSEAAAAVERLATVDSGQAAWIHAYLGALTQPFDFWPADDPAAEVTPADNDPPPARTRDEIAAAIRTAAGRVATVRTAIADLVGQAPGCPTPRSSPRWTPRSSLAPIRAKTTSTFPGSADPCRP